jgi:hypothetical protein
LTLTPAVSPTNTGTITMTYSSTPTYTTTQYVSPTATVTNTILLTITPTVTPTSTPVLDIYEPDDNFSMAQQILSGVEQTHSIMPAGDIDCVMFNVTTTSNVTLETSGTSESDDTVMELYSFNSVSGLYSFITDDDDGGNYLYSKITTILNPGTYYAMVYDYNTEDTITQYYLDLTVNILPTPTCTNNINFHTNTDSNADKIKYNYANFNAYFYSNNIYYFYQYFDSNTNAFIRQYNFPERGSFRNGFRCVYIY